MRVYKILAAAELGPHVYLGSADDRRDGFIHLSTGPQVAGTLQRHFAGRSDLSLCAFAAADLGAALVFEPSRGGALFPHLYGPLDLTRAQWTASLPLGPDGRHRLPEDVR